MCASTWPRWRDKGGNPSQEQKRFVLQLVLTAKNFGTVQIWLWRGQVQAGAEAVPPRAEGGRRMMTITVKGGAGQRTVIVAGAGQRTVTITMTAVITMTAAITMTVIVAAGAGQRKVVGGGAGQRKVAGGGAGRKKATAAGAGQRKAAAADAADRRKASAAADQRKAVVVVAVPAAVEGAKDKRWRDVAFSLHGVIRVPIEFREGLHELECSGCENLFLSEEETKFIAKTKEAIKAKEEQAMTSLTSVCRIGF